MTASTMRVGIVGPLLGANPGWVLSQGEVLASHLALDGVVVVTTSGVVDRTRRAIDTARTVWRWRDEIDVLVLMAFSGPSFAMTDLARRFGGSLHVPLVLWLHGGNLPAFAERHPRWVRTVLASADRIVAPSPYLAGTAEVFGLRADVISNIIPALHEGATPRRRLRPRLLWMRTFHPLYQPELAIEVLSLVRKEFPEAVLTMAGQDKGDLESVKRLVRSRSLDQHVRFVGFLDGAGKAQAFAENDLFLNTTRTDNAPVSLLEAASHGVPIVSTPAGGITRLFADGHTALLANDAAGLASAVRRLLVEPALAEAISDGGLDVARRATWSEVGPQWHRLLLEVTDSI